MSFRCHFSFISYCKKRLGGSPNPPPRAGEGLLVKLMTEIFEVADKCKFIIIKEPQGGILDLTNF